MKTSDSVTEACTVLYFVSTRLLCYIVVSYLGNQPYVLAVDIALGHMTLTDRLRQQATNNTFRFNSRVRNLLKAESFQRTDI